jgi:hypothetical protein
MWVNYDDIYAVSVDGLVMNRLSGNILSPGLRGKGYQFVILGRNKSM